jgi:hypothetical protein
MIFGTVPSAATIIAAVDFGYAPQHVSWLGLGQSSSFSV